LTPALPALAFSEDAIHVIKGLGCGCCTALTDILEKQGFDVTAEEIHPADLLKMKAHRAFRTI